jgi:predicted Rossmann fold nucleotide-binding protein DprA/Smf involved in DNA uptake
MNDQMKLAGFEPAIQSGAPPNSAGTGDSTPQAASNAKCRPHLHGQRHVIDKASECFPAAFRQLHNPPQRLFVIGDPAALEEGIAIIGARKATPYGIGCARRFAGIAARHGLTVI